MVGEEHGVGGGVTEGSVVGGRAVRGGVDVVFHFKGKNTNEKTMLHSLTHSLTQLLRHALTRIMFASFLAFNAFFSSC